MHKVTVYYTRFCPYCIMARRLLDQKQIAYEGISVDGKPDLRQEMTRLSQGHTVPQIFINDQPIGGYTELAALEQQGELDKMLADNA